MTQKAVVSATFVRLQTMADGTPRIIMDIDGTLADIADFGLHPGTTFVIARITDGAAKEDLQQKALKGGPLSIEAAGLCKNIYFKEWVGVVSDLDQTENGAKRYLYNLCGISSRAELDHNKEAELVFIEIKQRFINR